MDVLPLNHYLFIYCILNHYLFMYLLFIYFMFAVFAFKIKVVIVTHSILFNLHEQRSNKNVIILYTKHMFL